MIAFVASKLAEKQNVAETFIWQGEKEEDGLISEGLMFDMLQYFKIILNSIEKNQLIKELTDEGITIPHKSGSRINPK